MSEVSKVLLGSVGALSASLFVGDVNAKGYFTDKPPGVRESFLNQDRKIINAWNAAVRFGREYKVLCDTHAPEKPVDDRQKQMLDAFASHMQLITLFFYAFDNDPRNLGSALVGKYVNKRGEVFGRVETENITFRLRDSLVEARRFRDLFPGLACGYKEERLKMLKN